jgi:hypothetical protein
MLLVANQTHFISIIDDSDRFGGLGTEAIFTDDFTAVNQPAVYARGGRVVTRQTFAGLPAAMTLQAVWFVDRSGHRIGPLSTAELELAGQNALLEPEDQIWCQGLPRWFKVYEINGLTQQPALAQYRQAPPAPVQQSAPSAGRTAETYTQQMAHAIAHQIFVLLDRDKAATREGMSKNARLRDLSTRVFEAVPGAMRLALTHSVGRKFVETMIFDILTFIRGAISPATRREDLQQIALGQSAVLTARIDAAMAKIDGGNESKTSNRVGAPRPKNRRPAPHHRHDEPHQL